MLISRKKEWSVVCTDPSSGRNETKKHNLFSKEMRLSPKGKMNSPRDRFLPPKEMVVERHTPPRGRFTTLRENNVGRFRECSSRNKAFSPRGKFTPPNDKVVGKVPVQEGKFPRAGSCNRVVSLSKRRFLPKDRITCPNGRFLFPKREYCRQLHFSKGVGRERTCSSS